MDIQQTNFYRFAQKIATLIEESGGSMDLDAFSDLLEQEKFAEEEAFDLKAFTLFGYDNFMIWWLSGHYLKNHGDEKYVDFRNDKLIEPFNAEKNLLSFLLEYENGDETNIGHRFLQEFYQYVEAYKELQVFEIKQIGYWRSEDAFEEYPSAHDFINEFPYEGQEQVFEHLQAGTSMPWATPGVSTCRICGMPNGSSDLSDGKFMWPEGLAHYVKEHNLRLPKAFEEHIQSDWEALDTSSFLFGEYFVNHDWWKSTK